MEVFGIIGMSFGNELLVYIWNYLFKPNEETHKNS